MAKVSYLRGWGILNSRRELLKRIAITLVCFMTLLALHSEAFCQVISISTYNFNWENADVDSSIEMIRDVDCDIVCFQELNPVPFKRLRDSLLAIYPYWYRANQFAFCSKRRLDGFEASIHVNYAICRMQFGGRQIQIANVHLSPISLSGNVSLLSLLKEIGKQDSKHVDEVHGLLREIDSEAPSIILGDFNSVEGSKALALLLENGYVDCFASSNPGMPIAPTWQLNRMQALEKRSGQEETGPQIPIALRLDYVLASKELRPTKCSIKRAGGSDHFPVVATIELGAAN